MNIFILDENKRKAAQYHVDKHASKMVLETAQLLCSAVQEVMNQDIPELYRKCYVNHPCCKWARKTKSNFLWLVDFGKELSREYSFRYGRTHASASNIYLTESYKEHFPEGPLTSFAMAMPDKYKTDDPVESYRQYYIHEKSHLASWKKRNKPKWWNDENIQN